MRAATSISLVLLVGCSSAPPPRAPSAPAASHLVPAVAAPPVAAPPATARAPAPASDWRCEPAAPAAGVGASARLLARLPVCTGHLPGTTLTITAAPAPDRCGGVAIEVASDPDQRVVVGDDLAASWFFEAVATLEMPDPDDRAALDTWVAHVALFNYGNASQPLKAQVGGRASDAAQVLALARLVTVERRFAETFVRARIATAYLDEPARTAWCDAPAVAVEGVVRLMEADAARCRGLAERLPRGWWTDACADRLAPPPRGRPSRRPTARAR